MALERSDRHVQRNTIVELARRREDFGSELMADDLERVVLPGEPQIKIEREEGGRFSLSGGEALHPELPEAIERARERIEDCREAVEEADQRVLEVMDSSHREQDKLLDAREAYEKELGFLSEFVSWAEKVVGD